MPPTDPDAEIRLVAFDALRSLVARHGEILPWEVIAEGFQHRGERILFANRARGIFRPKQMTAGALSIKTTVPKAGRVARYDDLAVEGGFVYHFQGTDPDTFDNNALEYSASLDAPMIYFFGVAPARYLVLFPAYAGAIDRTALTCEVVIGSANELATRATTEVLRRRTVVAKPRWEHAILRDRTLSAWDHRCAVCSLSTPALLDASVVWPDGALRGAPEEDNALPLCLLHRDVFDLDLLGIEPVGTIRLARSLTAAVGGGPVLDAALKPFDGARVRWPSVSRPRDEFLPQRFERFARAA